MLSLFSGIGGIDLGLERAGMQTVAFCEVDPFCRAVLKKHWPEVPIHDDVRRLVAADLPSGIDLIAGGFPCQPFSVAGKQKGKEDERHLWPEFARLVRELRPRWVLAENVPGLRTIAADEVLADLEAAGYSAWPLVVGADDVGAPHRRKRVWIVGNSDTTRLERHRGNEPRASEGWSISGGPSATPSVCWPARPGQPQHEWEEPRLVAHAQRARSEGSGRPLDAGDEPAARSGQSSVGNAAQSGRVRAPELEDDAADRNRRRGSHAANADDDHGRKARCPEQPLGSAVDGLSERLVRTSERRARFANRQALKAYGNAVVPQVVEQIGRLIYHLDTISLETYIPNQPSKE